MATPSEETKSTVSKMAMSGAKLAFTGVKKSYSVVKKLLTKTPTSEFVTDEKETPVEVLGKIYKMMKIMDEDKKLNHEMSNSFLEEEELEKDKRNQEIIKALTGRKKIKQAAPKKRKVKEKTPTTPIVPKGGTQPPTTPTPPKTPKGTPKGGTQPPTQTPPAKSTQPPAKPPKTETKPATDAVKKKAEDEAAAAAKKKTQDEAAAAAKKKAEDVAKKKADDEAKATAKRLKDEEARKTAEKVKVEKDAAAKKAAEESKRTATKTEVKPSVRPPAPPVSSSPVIPGVSAAAAASMSLEVGATTKESALQSVGKIVPNDPEPGVFSYGLFGINSKRRNGKDSSIDSFIRDNPQFNLPDPGNTKTFQKSWEKLAKEKPEELFQAQIKWYKDRVENPTIATLSKYAPKEIYSHPAVTVYMSDRANQYGPLANWTGALKYAEGSKDYKEFLEKVSEYDKAHLEQNFKTYLSNNPKNKKGLEERIRKRLERALNIRVEPTPNVIPNQYGEKINQESVKNQDGKKELNAQSQTTRSNTTIINNMPSSTTTNIEKEDDRSPMNKKVKQ